MDHLGKKVNVLRQENRFARTNTVLASNNYYSQYLAQEVDSGREVAWIEVVVTDSDRELMVNWARFALEFSQKAPSFLVKLSAFFFVDNNKRMVIISEYLNAITMKQFVEKEYSSSRFFNDQESYFKLIRKFVACAAEYVSYLSNVEPIFYLPMCSLRSFYLLPDLESFKMVYLPLFIFQIKGSALNFLRYVPPEVMKGETPSASTAMYSVGVCVLEMLTATRGLDLAGLTSIISRIRDPEIFDTQLANVVDPFLQKLLVNLLGPASSRPSCHEVLRDIECEGSEELRRITRSSSHSIRNSAPKLDVNVVSDSLISHGDMEIEAIHSSSCSSHDVSSFGHEELRIPVDFCKLNLVFEKQENAEGSDSNNTDRLEVLIDSRVDNCFQLKVQRCYSNGNRKTIGVLFHYGEETINSVVCELSKLNFIPEIMVEVVSENIQIWFDNFIKASFVNLNPGVDE